jgi:hypothetical protein
MKIDAYPKGRTVIFCFVFLCLFMGINTFAEPKNQDRLIDSWVADLTSFGARRTGTPSCRKAEMYIRAVMKRFGIHSITILETPEMYLQKNAEWGLAIGGKSIDCFPVHSSFRPSDGFGPFTTGRNGLTAEVLDVGDAFDESGGLTFNPADVNGRIVLFNFHLPPVPFSTLFYFSEFIHDPGGTIDPADVLHQPYLSNFSAVRDYVLSMGAVGFVGILADYFDSCSYFNEDFLASRNLTIPGVWVKASDGAKIRNCLKSVSTLTMTLKGRYKSVTGRTVIGFLPGQSPDTVMISSHYDSVWEGGVEDASGTAEVLALARHYAALPVTRRPKSLMFVLNDTHFIGYQGHENFIGRYIDTKWNGHRIIANVSVEHIAKEARIECGGRLVLTGRPEPLAVFHNAGQDVGLAIRKAIRENGLDRTIVLPTTTPFGVPTDAWMMAETDVPVITMISAPIYLYDRVDTLRMVDEERLATVANTFIRIVDAIGLMDAETIRGR